MNEDKDSFCKDDIVVYSFEPRFLEVCSICMALASIKEDQAELPV